MKMALLTLFLLSCAAHTYHFNQKYLESKYHTEPFKLYDSNQNGIYDWGDLVEFYIDRNGDGLTDMISTHYIYGAAPGGHTCSPIITPHKVVLDRDCNGIFDVMLFKFDSNGNAGEVVPLKPGFNKAKLFYFLLPAAGLMLSVHGTDRDQKRD